MSGTLTNSVTGQGIAGEPVTLTLNGTQSCSGTSGSGGTVTCALTPNEQAGSYTLSGSFAGDSSKSPQLLSSGGTNTFVVTKAATTVVETAPSMVVSDSAATLSASFTTAGGSGPSGLPVVLTLGSGTSAQTCTGTASSSGLATCTIADVSQTAGSVATTASFAGDGYYLPAGNSAIVTDVNPGQMSCLGGPQNLCIAPQGANEGVTGTSGQTVVAGYDFTIPGSSQPTEVEVVNAYEQLTVSCANHTTPTQPSIVITMPDATYTAPFTSSQGWIPSGNQSVMASYEGSYTLPNLCNGATIDVGQPGQMLFGAQVYSNGTQTINFRSHYNDSSLGVSGSFSSTASVTPTPIPA